MEFILKKTDKKMGEILLENGIISETQLEEGLKISAEKGIRIGEALMQMGAITEDHILWVLGTQMSTTYVDLDEDMIDRDLIAQFPIDILMGNCFLPLYVVNNEMTIVMGDPTDIKALENIQSAIPGKIFKIHLASPEKIKRILLEQKLYTIELNISKINIDEGAFYELYETPEINNARFFAWLLYKLVINPGSALQICPKLDSIKIRLINKEKITELTQYSDSLHPVVVDILKRSTRLNNLPAYRIVSGCFMGSKEQKNLIFRVTFIPSMAGKVISIRKVDEINHTQTSLYFKIPKSGQKMIQELLKIKNGIIIISSDEEQQMLSLTYNLLEKLKDKNKEIYTIEREVCLKVTDYIQIDLANNTISLVDAINSLSLFYPNVIFINEKTDDSAFFEIMKLVENGSIVILSLIASSLDNALLNLFTKSFNKKVILDDIRYIVICGKNKYDLTKVDSSFEKKFI